MLQLTCPDYEEINIQPLSHTFLCPRTLQDHISSTHYIIAPKSSHSSHPPNHPYHSFLNKHARTHVCRTTTAKGPQTTTKENHHRQGISPLPHPPSIRPIPNTPYPSSSHSKPSKSVAPPIVNSSPEAHTYIHLYIVEFPDRSPPPRSAYPRW